MDLDLDLDLQGEDSGLDLEGNDLDLDLIFEDLTKHLPTLADSGRAVAPFKLGLCC